MRQKRDKISKDIADMDYKQIKEYFARKKERILPGIHEKEAHQFVSLEEFADYTGLPVELIKEHIID